MLRQHDEELASALVSRALQGHLTTLMEVIERALTEDRETLEQLRPGSCTPDDYLKGRISALKEVLNLPQEASQFLEAVSSKTE